MPQLFVLSLLLLLGLAPVCKAALNPAVIKGYKFFDNITRKEIVIRGIDYYPRPNTGVYDRNSVDFFTEDFRDAWERDLPFLKQLGVNAIRLYSVDPNENHDAFMCALNQAGIYAIIELASDCPGCAITRDKVPACYPTDLKLRGQAVMQEFAKYANTLAFSTGNEVNHFAPPGEPEWNGACQKKFVRDMRVFARSCPTMRKVPIGLVAADSDRDENALYYNCQGDAEDPYENAEWFGLNSYLFCNHEAEEYKDAAGMIGLQKSFERYRYSIPAILTEYGCLSLSFDNVTVNGVVYEGQRDFKQTDWLISEPKLRDQFAGGFVFEYSTELRNAIGDSPYPFSSFGGQNYGVGYFEPEDCDDILTPCIFKPLPNYHNLQAAYNQTLNSTMAVTMDSFEVPMDRKKRTKCPSKFMSISYYDWTADKIKDLSCPLSGNDSEFICPANLELLRGHRNSKKYHYHTHFHMPDGILFFGIISAIALTLAYCLMEKEAAAEDTEWRRISSHQVKLYSCQDTGDTSDESTGLLSMPELSDAESKTAYQSIEEP
jgi:hypothetical protein